MQDRKNLWLCIVLKLKKFSVVFGLGHLKYVKKHEKNEAGLGVVYLRNYATY